MRPRDVVDGRARAALCALVTWLIAVSVVACSSRRRDASTDEPASTAQGSPETSRELVVFAAASLRDVFGELSTGFEGSRSNVKVTFNFAGSQELRTQIEHGATVDVFASADRRHVDALARHELAGPLVIFARNQPVVIVAKGATRIARFQDLPAAERIIIGAPEVPIGRYTRQVLDKATMVWPGFAERVLARVVSQELNVRQVLAKIVLGEADAGIVYRTDAASAASKVDVIAIPDELNVSTEYPMAVLARSRNAALAAAWVEYVRSPVGQAVLARHGFTPPAADSGP